jgi:hypothetical protein
MISGGCVVLAAEFQEDFEGLPVVDFRLGEPLLVPVDPAELMVGDGGAVPVAEL